MSIRVLCLTFSLSFFKQKTEHHLHSGIPGEVSVLIECTGGDPELDQQRVDKFAEYVVDQGIVVDAVLSQSEQQEKVSYWVFVCSFLTCKCIVYVQIMHRCCTSTAKIVFSFLILR